MAEGIATLKVSALKTVAASVHAADEHVVPPHQETRQGDGDAADRR